MTKNLDKDDPVTEAGGNGTGAGHEAGQVSDQALGQAAGTRRHADVAAEQRKARAAKKLRENLMRRKEQQRSRRQGQADETEGLPAAKSPDRDD